MYFDKFGVNFGNIKLKIRIGARVLHYHTSPRPTVFEDLPYRRFIAFKILLRIGGAQLTKTFGFKYA